MDAVAQLRESYTAFSEYITDLVPDDGDYNAADDVRLYVVSAMLRIWGRNNMLYSDAYSRALEAVSGEPYTRAQIVTAMSCCAEHGRDINVPGFIEELAELDDAAHTHNSRRAVEMLNELLVAAAYVNGDFTIEEADAVAQIIDALSEYCRCGDADFDTDTASLLEMVTEPKADSYVSIQNEQSANAAVDTEHPETEISSSDGITIPITLTLSFDASDADDEQAVEYGTPEAAAISKPSAPADESSLEELLDELDSLIGLDTVKHDVHSLINFIKVTKLRRERGMKVPTVSYHLVFTGNPGTGKTTVARLVAKLYYHMGLLPQGQLVEADRSTLVAGFLGQTALKTQKVIQQALGGVLFIDEAYSLAEDAGDSYGREAIETILKAMEDHRDELVVIVAGYDGLMHSFIESNPGLASRFSKYFHFPDYDGDELLRIFERFCKSNGYMIERSGADMLLAGFSRMYASRDEHFGNARAVRNIFEKAINCQANRLAEKLDITDRDLMLLSQEDIGTAMES